MKKIKLSVLFFFVSLCVLSQNINSKIESSVENFYKLDRENIHLHFNKTTYLNTDIVWFKGYIIEKKESKLNTLTTNVHVRLLDKNNVEIFNKLYYATNGLIEGSFEIENDIPSGEYYVHAYTNYMNNFKENESILYPLMLLNITEKIIENNTNSNENLTINFGYEGGKFLANSFNTIGVKITDCKNKGVKISNIQVLDENKNVINSFPTNIEGFGKFDIIDTKKSIYSIFFTLNGKEINKPLAIPVSEGINLNVLNYANPENTILIINTNETTLNTLKNKELNIVIQKSNSLGFIPVKLDNITKEIVLNKSNFLYGLNTIRIVDENLNLLSERQIFINKPQTDNIDIVNIIKTKDSVKVKCKISKIGNFSITSLPKNTISNFTKNCIYESLVFKNNLEDYNINYQYYFNDFNKRKEFELDLTLLHIQKNKYNWNDIINNSPSEKYTFDVGVTISGKINQNLTDRSKLKLRLFSINGINETTTINDKNEFEFKNILAIDSTNFHFTLLKKDEKLETLNIYSNLTNNKKPFLKKINLPKYECNSISFVKSTSNDINDFPLLENTTILDDVEVITVAKKPKLVNENTISTRMAKGYKISETDQLSFRDVISFIQSHGYDVSREGGNVTIRNRVSTSFLGSRTPVIYLDGVILNDLNFLYSIQLYDVDEIYFNKRGFGLGNDGSNGAISIFSKKTFGSDKKGVNIKSKSMVIKDGFQDVRNFENAKYASYEAESFQKHGTVDWIPNVYTDESGNFEFTIPHFNQEKIKLNIQGIDNFGQLYYNNFEIEVK